MSQTTEDIQDGIVCQVCGVWMPDMFDVNEKPTDLWEKPPGYPRTCPDCEDDK